MSQAQALLDCTADLVEHCGVLAAVDVLQVTLLAMFKTSLLFCARRTCRSCSPEADRLGFRV